MALTKINSSVIANNTVALGNIADNSVDATKIASNSILTRHIDDDQITGDQLADNIDIAGTLDVTGATTLDGILNTDNSYTYLKGDSTSNASLTLRKGASGADAIDYLQLRNNANSLIGKIAGDGDITFVDGTFSGALGVTGVSTLTGNVGIGTSTVRATTHIKNAGNNWEDGLLLEGDSGNKGWNFHTETSGELLIGYNAATNAALTDQAATTVLNLQTDGQVGINVDPTAYLDVRAPSGVSGPNVAYFKSDQHGLGVYINIGSTYSEIRSNNNSYALVLNASSGGNVGIGTTAPAETLHIKRADGSAIVVESSNDQNNTGDRVAVEFRSDAGMGLSKVVGGKHSNYQSAGARDGYLSLQNFISNSWVERMRIQPDGVTKLVGGETGGRNDLLFNNGAMSLADNAAYTLSGVANTGVLIAIGQQRSVSGITYDHCLIFAEHSTALTMVANPSGRFGTSSGTDTLTNIYVSGGDVILENKVGTTNGYTFACFVFQGN